MTNLQVVPRRHNLARPHNRSAYQHPVYIDRSIGAIVDSSHMTPLAHRHGRGSRGDPLPAPADIYAKHHTLRTRELQGIAILLPGSFTGLLDDGRGKCVERQPRINPGFN